MTFAGVGKIARFNWPWYAGALAATVGGIALLRSDVLRGPWNALVLAGLVAANGWLLLSLAVSHYVYDRSTVARAGWLDGVLPESVRRAAVFHAGHDEASAAVARALPASDLQSFDFHDGASRASASLRRARALAVRNGAPMSPEHIPLGDESLDLALVVFAAHEIRSEARRAAFFRELLRVLAVSGRVVLVEHLRDGWNLLAYGPGAFHFQSRATWIRAFSVSGLRLLREVAATPFVRVFELGRPR